jgi:hypothetical protein
MTERGKKAWRIVWDRLSSHGYSHASPSAPDHRRPAASFFSPE